MDIGYLYYFKKLAEVLNYTKAAEQLHITQPSLSYAISRLEKELGYTFFQKSGRRISLNTYGRIYYQYVCNALADLEDGEKALSRQQKSGRIVMGITKSMIHSAFSVKIIDSYIAEHPEDQGRIELSCYASSASVVDDLLSGVLDIGICLYRNDTRLKQFCIYRRDMCAIMNANHPLAARTEVSCEELCNYRLALYQPEISRNSAYFLELFEKLGRPIRADFFDEYVDIVYYAINHNTIAIKPRDTQLESLPYHICSINDYPNDMNFYMTICADAPRHAGAEPFYQYCRKQYCLQT